MTDATPDRDWAGRTVFPRSTAELRSTTICPACLTPLRATVCASCGLDLRHPAAADLAAASAEIADALDARLDIIGRIRRATAGEPAAVPAPAAAVAAAPLTVAAPEVAAAPPAAAGQADADAHLSDEQLDALLAEPSRAAGGRSGIQIALVVVGISLLSVFAIFGLVYAFVTFGSTVRMAIIVGGTLATMIAAGRLARRGLGATGEGVAALGTLMLALDAWALRLNDPDGLGATDSVPYWGAALLVVGVAAALWARTTRLITPGVAAAGLLPVGAALLVGHLVESTVAPSGAVLAGALCALALSAVSPWAARPDAVSQRAALIIARTIGAAAGIAGLVSIATIEPASRWAPLLAGLLLAGAALLPVVATARGRAALTPVDRLALVASGGGAALAAIVGATAAAVRFDQERVVVSAPLIAAVLVAVAAEQAWRRGLGGERARAAFAAATLTAASLAALGGGLAGVVGSGALLEASTQSFEVLPLGPTDPVASGDPASVAALGALALALGLIAASWALLGVLLRRARALTALAALVIVALVPLLPAWWLVMLVYGVLAIGAGLALRPAQGLASTDARRALLVLLAPLSAGAALSAWAIAWAVPRGAGIGLAIALLAIAAGRAACRRPVVRAIASAGAAALALGSIAPLVAELTRATPALQPSGGSTVIALAAVIALSAQLGRLAVLERHAALGVAALAAVAASFAPRQPLVDETIALGLALAALAVVAVRGERPAQLAARILVPLAIARTAVLASNGAALPAGSAELIALGALAVGAVIALLADERRPAGDDAVAGAGDTADDTADVTATSAASPAARSRTLRSTLTGAGAARSVGDAATLVAAGVVLVGAETVLPRGDAWLPLLLGAVVVLVLAISRDGLVGSASPRRFLGWGALALATAALWSRLAVDAVTAPEPYTLPLAGALLAIAAAMARSARARSPRPRGVAPIVGIAAVVALLPSAVHDPLTDPLRGIAVAAVATALLLVGMLAHDRAEQHLPGISAALAGAGTAALAVGAVVHAIALTAGTGAGTDGAPTLVGVQLAHAVITVALPAALAVAAQLLARGHLRDGAVAGLLGSAALAAAALGFVGALSAVELVSLPAALAAIVVGGLRLAEHPSTRSWPMLAPGLALLLLPSLLAIDGAGEPLWRAVALGLVAAAVFGAGLRLRLQAPFVLGGAALLVHLLVQSWPLLELVGRAVQWWLWLGLAGVVIVALAARYERRLQNARDLARRISELR